MDMLDASNLLVYLMPKQDHHKIRCVNLEIIYEEDAGEQSAEIAADLQSEGFDAQAIIIEDPSGQEYPSIMIQGW